MSNSLLFLSLLLSCLTQSGHHRVTWLSQDTTIPLLRMYTRTQNTFVQENVCINVHSVQQMNEQTND